MKRILHLTALLLITSTLFAQEATYDVTPGIGNGLRFWSSDSYKIHMGNGSVYHYGPVTDYSIKMNMNNESDRGWTWGVIGSTPTAALNTQGTLQLAKDLRVMGNLGIGTTSPNYPLKVVYPSYSISQNITSYKINAEFNNANIYGIPAGLKDDGYRMGLNINSHIRTSDFQSVMHGDALDLKKYIEKEKKTERYSFFFVCC